MLRSLRELVESVAAGRGPTGLDQRPPASALDEALWPIACRLAERTAVGRWLAGDEGALDVLPSPRRALLQLARVLNRAAPMASLSAHWALAQAHAREADMAPEDPDHPRLLEKLRLTLTALGHRGPSPVPPLYRAHPDGWRPSAQLSRSQTLEDAVLAIRERLRCQRPS